MQLFIAISWDVSLRGSEVNEAAFMTAIYRRMGRARRQLSNGGLGSQFGAREVADSPAAKIAILLASWLFFEGVHWQIFINKGRRDV
jgi:hypothetical protein